MADNTQNLNVKSVARYMLLPGIAPRVRDFASDGFGYLAFLFATIYGGVRILRPGHPFLNPDNIGKFGILDVLRAASNNLVLKWGNLDQIVVFFALIAGMILMVLQFVLLVLTLFSGKAFAMGPGGPFENIFVTPNPVNDLAFTLLDMVFGIPPAGGIVMGPNLGFFGSSANPLGPTPFHQGLHALFNFYNLAILLVAVLIFLYYVIVVVIETAQTGVPFGRRFSKVYAPIRLIVAVGLLVPLNYGFNGAQYITLYAAKFGSSFATNGWILYNETLTNPMGAQDNSLLARPKTPAVDDLLYFSSVYHACREMYEIWNPLFFQRPAAGGTIIRPYVIVNGTAEEFLGYDYDEAKAAFGANDIEVVLGELDPEEHISYAGGVRPYCGKITISLSNENPTIFEGGEDGGIRAIERLWYTFVQTILREEGQFAAFGERAAHTFVPAIAHQTPCWASGEIDEGGLGDAGQCGNPNWFPPATAFSDQLSTARTTNAADIMEIYNEFRNNLNVELPDELRARGWGGAGIWYNNIADLNGTFAGAIYAVPTVKQFPEVMEYVKQQRQIQDATTGLCETFDPNIANNQQVSFRYTNEMYTARALNATYKYHMCERPNQETDGGGGGGGAAAGACGDATMTAGGSTRGVTTNTFVNVVSIIFGINGLFDIRCNSEIDAATGMTIVHPLAQLSVVGKSLVENAIRSMGMALFSSFGGGILGVLNQSLGAAMESASGMFVGIATIGLTAGFILYYILPFLPFMYFFFAVGSWVKSIFEAMVGVPLWALAHLRIDGDGLPGRAAAGGYFLILEIALRPIFTVFGLIAGMAVFGAMAVALNHLFDLVVLNITGPASGDGGPTIIMGAVESLRRGVIDQFFFTIMYALLLYLMATSSFKMIDTIPQHVMRWIGSSVGTFNDNKQDPTAGLTQYTAIAGSQIAPQILGGLQTGARTLGRAGGELFRPAIEPTPPPTPPRDGPA